MFTRKLLNTTLASETLTIAEWIAPANTKDLPIAPPHIHFEDDEIWYVLDGTLGFRLNDETHEVSAGGCLIAQRGVAHTWWNATDNEARYLLVMTRQNSDLVAAIHDPELAAGRSMQQLFSDFSSKLLDF